MYLLNLNIVLIVAATWLAGRHQTAKWKLLAFAVVSATFSLARLRLAFGIPVGDALLMPHAVMGVVLGAGLLVSQPPGGRVTLNLPFTMMVVVAGITVAAGTIGYTWRPAWVAFSTLTCFGPALFFGAARRLDDDERAALVRLIAVAVALSVATGLPAYLFPDMGGLVPDFDMNAGEYRIFTTLGNPLTQGALCLLVLPWLLRAMVDEPQKLRTAFLVLLLGAGVLLSGSRILIPLGILAVFAVGVVNINRFTRAVLPLLLVVCLGVILFWQLAQTLPYITQPVERALAFRDVTVSPRAISALTASTLVRERPFGGWGPGQLYIWSRTVVRGTDVLALSLPEGASLVEPHNLVLLIAVEYGIPTVLLFACLALTILWRVGMRRGRGITPLHATAAWGIALFLLQTAGSSDLAIMPHVGVIFWTWAGCIVDPRRLGELVQSSDRVGRRLEGESPRVAGVAAIGPAGPDFELPPIRSGHGDLDGPLDEVLGMPATGLAPERTSAGSSDLFDLSSVVAAADESSFLHVARNRSNS